ncbi:hypothetical protein AN958_07157 [Leucoagaricus sp. SymC.cos]|nr:hypothetical protein AN958_07157 [Leucoagaricus sp. SymC.cos]
MASTPLPVLETIPPLDPNFLNLNQEESEFFKALTGITDGDILRQHIIDVQAKAYQIYYYPCIRLFGFTNLKISRLPAYNNAIYLRSIRPDAILLDVGCCFGNDLRKAILDGWPVQNTIGTDLEEGFWQYGHELFKSSPATFQAGFVAGDIFSDTLTPPCEPFYEAPSTVRPASLRNLQSLSPLQGHISAIHASSLFHLFDEDKQASLAKRLASLLSPEPGSMIFGSHGGLPEKGNRLEIPNSSMFCHSPESWKDLWDGQVFSKGSVRVDVQLKLIEKSGLQIFSKGEGKFYLLLWSVTRL